MTTSSLPAAREYERQHGELFDEFTRNACFERVLGNGARKPRGVVAQVPRGDRPRIRARVSPSLSSAERRERVPAVGDRRAGWGCVIWCASAVRGNKTPIFERNCDLKSVFLHYSLAPDQSMV